MMLVRPCMAAFVMLLGLRGIQAADLPSRESAERDEFLADIAELKALCEGGDTDAVLSHLDALFEALKARGLTPTRSAQVAQQALSAILWSDVGNKDVIRAAAAKHALAAITATKVKGTADFELSIASLELMEQQMTIALIVLPRTSATREQNAEVALDIWADLLGEIQRYSEFDMHNPNGAGRMLKLPLPPPDEPFNFGQDPSTIKDPEFRSRYVEFLEKQAEFGRKGRKYDHLCQVRDRFFPAFRIVWNAAFSGDAEKEKAGTAVIERRVSDPVMRRKLLEAIRSTPASRPREGARNDSKAFGWLSLRRGPVMGKAIHALSVPAKTGTVVVRGRYRSRPPCQ